VAGCSVADDFTHPMGDAAEAALHAAALNTGRAAPSCPAAGGSSRTTVKASFDADGGLSLAVSNRRHARTTSSEWVSSISRKARA
jgi:hypothetical protein